MVSLSNNSARNVKRYYVAGEFYDWVTDPRALERIFHWGRSTVAKRLIRRLSKSRLALDIGCGTGLITRFISSSQVVGIDINRWNLDRAKGRIPDADFLQCDIEHLPLRTGLADFVICTEVVEHLSLPSRSISEIARVMSPNGTFIGSVPSGNPLWRFRNILSVTHPQSEPFHNNFSKVQLRGLLSGSFTDTNIFYENLLMNLFFTARRPMLGTE
ncbi:MAG TPA: class I SAM-dependent methyltransferase [Candidatus Sulfotelmatobacter sp.]|nr:class I SAM-dependent methyltransferase [Candidatus Sulfotelmatobacter sp.]